MEHGFIFICHPPNATHLCQPLDVAAFRPAKFEWKGILDTWRWESRRKGNLPEDVFPSLLRKLMGRLKPSNLVSGFKAAGIYPLDAHQILKKFPSEGSDDIINESIFNDAVLNVFKENCGIRVPKKRVQAKR